MRRSPYLRFGLLYAAIAALYAWPLLASLSSRLPHDPADPALNAWILWWNSHAVPFTRAWWDAPLFYPGQGSLALSETLLGIAVIANPLQWLGASAVTAHNIAFVLSFPAAAIGAHALVRHLTGRHDAGLVAGLAFGFSPYRAAQMPHIQMEWTCWMPLCLLALHTYLDRGQRRYLAGATVCWMLNGLTNGYFLVFFSVLVGLWALWFLRTRRDWIAVTLALGAGSLPLVPLLAGHMHYQTLMGLSRDPLEIYDFSADLTAIWAGSAHAWFSSHWTLHPRPEGELYPGIAILGLTIVGAMLALYHSGTRSSRGRIVFTTIAVVLVVTTVVFRASDGWPFNALGMPMSQRRAPLVLAISGALLGFAIVTHHRVRESWRSRSVFFFYLAAALAMFAFAMGPVARAAGGAFLSHTPYGALMALPGGHGLRVPARFSMLMILCLVTVAGLAWARLTQNRSSKVGLGAVCLVVLVDGWVPKLPTVPVATTVMLADVPRGVPLLELPLRDLYTETSAEVRATYHGHPLVNGYSGYEPPHYGPLRSGLQWGDPTVFDALRQFGPVAVLLNSDEDPVGSHTDFVATTPGAKALSRTPIGPVYLLPALPARPRTLASGSKELPIARIINRWSQDVSSVLTDRNIKTEWKSDLPQMVGDILTLTFSRPVVVDRVELDLGGAAQDYPRGLAISVEQEDGSSEVLWNNGTAGATFLAAYDDHATTPLRIDLDRRVRGPRLTLRLTQSDAVYYWTMAEVRIFGHEE